jgi:preprotein translocase subunit SecG
MIVVILLQRSEGGGLGLGTGGGVGGLMSGQWHGERAEHAHDGGAGDDLHRDVAWGLRILGQEFGVGGPVGRR